MLLGIPVIEVAFGGAVNVGFHNVMAHRCFVPGLATQIQCELQQVCACPGIPLCNGICKRTDYPDRTCGFRLLFFGRLLLHGAIEHICKIDISFGGVYRMAQVSMAVVEVQYIFQQHIAVLAA